MARDAPPLSPLRSPTGGPGPEPGRVWVAPVVGLLLVGAAALVLALRRRSGPGTAAR
jgi:hypothetical protein